MSEGNGTRLRVVGALPWSDRGGDPRERCTDIASKADLSWQEDAACVDIGTAVFFPEVGENPDGAKAVCEGCPVRETCLEYALGIESRPGVVAHGVWGALAPDEREYIIRERKRQAAA